MARFKFGFRSIRFLCPTPPVILCLLVLTMQESALPAQDFLPAHPPTPGSNSVTTQAASVAASSALSQEDLADLHMARKRYQAALEIYHQIPQKSAAVWNKIGIANQQMFMLEAAQKSYEMSLKLDGRNADVMNNLGTIFYSQKLYSSAERYYRKALKLKPKSAIIYKNLGTALLAEDKFKKGWECYQAALALDPDIFERTNLYRVGGPTASQKRGAMNYFLAKSYLLAGMTDRAVGYLRMAIDEGFTDRKRLMSDKEFAGLRGISSFEQLLAEQQLQ